MQAIQGMKHSAHHVNDLRAGIDGEGLADGLAAHGQPRHESGHDQRNAPRPAYLHLSEDQRRNGRRRAAGDNAADVAHHVVADGADPLRVAMASWEPGTFRAAME